MSDDIISKSGQVVGKWNGVSVADLQKELQKIKMDLRKQGKKDKVKREVMTFPPKYGGINVPNIRCVIF